MAPKWFLVVNRGLLCANCERESREASFRYNIQGLYFTDKYNAVVDTM